MKIRRVEENSLAEKRGLSSEDEIIEINNKFIRDIIDYRFYTAEGKLEFLVKDKKNRLKKIKIRKRSDQDLGIILKEGRYRRCPNSCIFCFVDQLPPGLRKSLYFKDEDYRLSFLHGNFITLTNLSNEDIKRIPEQRISPLYVSVHTTDDNLRKKMLSNTRIPSILSLIKELTQNRIELHTQVVLCPGINDGDYLKQTVFDLASFYPYVRSLAVVPVGLTKFRENLPRIRGVSKKYSEEIIKKVKEWQKSFRKEFNENFVYLSDEFFLKAGLDIPSARYYDDFYQIENGVGLVRKFLDDFKKEQNLFPKKLKRKLEITLITGKLSAGVIKKIIKEKMNRIKNLMVKVVEVRNDFFGNTVTVSGLLAGLNIINALKKEKKLGEMILLPPDCVNVDGVFLDDLKPKDIEKIFKRKVVVGSYSIVQTFLDLFKETEMI
jgi:putative radical SAM enzyme (TIGR03279 family)